MATNADTATNTTPVARKEDADAPTSERVEAPASGIRVESRERRGERKDYYCLR